MKKMMSMTLGVLVLACSAPGADLHLGQTLAEWRTQLEASDRTDRLLASRAVGEMAIAGVRGADKALFAAIGHQGGIAACAIGLSLPPGRWASAASPVSAGCEERCEIPLPRFVAGRLTPPFNSAMASGRCRS